jgi:hypothetical protein
MLDLMPSAVAPPAPQRAPTAYGTLSRSWLWVSIVAALAAAVGNIVALTRPGDVYGRETVPFIHQALAQDIIGLAVVSPLVIITALLAHRSSLIAYLVWLGGLSFLVYHYVIYAMAIHVGVLFLPWTLVLGLSLFTLIAGLKTIDATAVRERFVSAPRRTAGWCLIIVATLFTAVWLRDIIPAIAGGRIPAGAQELGLPASPVHVLDLAFYLPAAFAAGVLLLRNRAFAYVIAPAMLLFLTLTGLPILLTPLVAAGRGDEPGWTVLPPIGAITLTSLALTVRLLSSARRPSDRDL